VVTPSGVQSAFVIINDGVITEVLDALPEGSLIQVTDIGDKVLMPGVIDTHVHINEPGRTEWEGFETATRAAIAGGITMLVDMPLNASPVTTSVAAFDEKVAATKNKLFTNVGFWGGLVPGNENEIEGLVQKGVLGFKAFLTHSGIDDFPNVTEDYLRKAMPVIGKHNLPLLVHCELTTDEISTTTNKRSYQQYLASRPKEWEDNAIDLMIRLCEEFNCRVHIVHLSSANSVEKIAEARQRGLPITVETGQHYLYFNAEEIPDGNTAFKCAPPIREKANNDQLWQALKDSIIDFVATDHSPAPPVIKELESGDFTKAWGGISSVQFALPVLWTAARKRGFTISDIVKWLCEEPAVLAGMSTSKGKIAKGYDADLVVFDEEKSFLVTEDIIRHRHKITPYLQEELFGVVEQTYLAGEKVFDNGTIFQKSGKIITSIDAQL
jgi:allantoinase